MWADVTPDIINLKDHHSSIKNIGELIGNVDKVPTTIGNGKCLAISKSTGASATLEKLADPIKLSVIQESCNNQHYAVCKLRPSDQATTTLPLPKFPCLSKSTSKKKRETVDGNFF